MATICQSFDSSQDASPELFLDTAGQVSIQEETVHIPSPSHTTNTCFVSGRLLHRPAILMERDTSDCSEAVKVELKTEFQLFKTEMNTKIDSMKYELIQKSVEIDMLIQYREKIRVALENLREKLNLMEREKRLDKREFQMEMQEKNDEIKRLRDRNQELETKVKDLTKEKTILEVCVRNHTHKVEILEAKLDKLKNQNDQEMNEVNKLKAALSTNRHQCNHDSESMAALEARMIESMTQMMSNLRTRGGEQSLSNLSVVDKVMDKSGGSSKSNAPLSTSPANSDHSSKSLTPPPE